MKIVISGSPTLYTRPNKIQAKICLNKHHHQRSLGQPVGIVSQQGDAVRQL